MLDAGPLPGYGRAPVTPSPGPRPRATARGDAEGPRPHPEDAMLPRPARLPLYALAALLACLVLAAAGRADKKPNPAADAKKAAEEARKAEEKAAKAQANLVKQEVNGELGEVIKEAYILVAAAN